MSEVRPIKLFQLLLIILLAMLTGCAARQPVPPGTIPNQASLTRQEEAYGQAVLAELTKQFPLDRTPAYNQRVKSLVQQLAKAGNADKYPWYVYVLKGDDVLNAAATRGNHVFVWTGMLKFAKSDDQLAAVIGHELSHVLAGHTQPTPMEQVNQILVGIAGQATSLAIGSQAGGIGGQLASTAAQALLVNPGSKRVELEADQIGLFMMARAGYNPQSAITLWERMKEQQGGSDGVLAFMSTHPPSSDRIDKLKDLMPSALQDYQSAGRAPKRVIVSEKIEYPDAKYQPSESASASKKPQPILTARVVAGRTPVFNNPNTESQPRAILYRGDRVRVIQELPQWVGIDKPLVGFMYKRDLKPE